MNDEPTLFEPGPMERAFYVDEQPFASVACPDRHTVSPVVDGHDERNTDIRWACTSVGNRVVDAVARSVT